MGEAARTRARRRTGRALVEAILEATIAEIDEVGYAELSMERVAERAQASKASLYRRWPGKVALVVDAAYHVLPDPAGLADTGTVRGDLLTVLRHMGDQVAGPAGRAMRGVLGDVLRDPARAEEFRSRTRGSSVAMIETVLRRAHARGELDADTVTQRQREAGPALLRLHVLTHDGPVPDEVIVGIVDEVVLPLLGSYPATRGDDAGQPLRRRADGRPRA
ncbi:MAG: TetR/AcrR family transcriptional regulator [Pseudonocardia sp.]|nr:TetR/AcrR family transcriptional regulator [Pseudonocardia sp.]